MVVVPSRKPLLSCIAVLSLLGALQKVQAGFDPLPLAPGSFTQDVVVESNAPPPLLNNRFTTASMDAGFGNTAYSWYEQGYNTANPGTGLPPAGSTFTHQNAANHQYQLAPSYRQNNAILLDSSATSTTVTLTTPAAYTQLSFLESGGHNGVAFGYAVHHQNGTTDTGTGSIPDWFSGANQAFTANGRVDVGSFAFDSVNGNNPRLYAIDVTLGNTGSPVTSIDFTYVSGTGHGAILAISGKQSLNFTPVAFTGYNADIVVEAAAGQVLNATTATIETGTANTMHTFYEQGYVATAPDTGLPPAGSIVSSLSAGDHRYQLASSYTGNNAVLIGAGSSASLRLATPTACPGLSFLTASANGPVTLSCVVQHLSGLSETNAFISPDWFTRSPMALLANGRVDVSARTVDTVYGNNPRLYSVDITLNNRTSPVTNILLGFKAGSSTANAVVFAVSGGASALPLPGEDFNANAAAAAAMLQQWYNSGGLWDTTGWWNSANCIEAIESVIEANNGSQYTEVLTNTFTRNSGNNFLNWYYDDEGWWALAWIRAYDLTGNTNFLNMAKVIFNDLTIGWDNTCNGGLWWSRDRNYKNAIPNELFLLCAARLHQRTPGDLGPGSYLDWATNEWSWFKASTMINAQNLVNDGLTSGCANNGQPTWTYNQGVILGGLTDLYKSTGDSNYLNQATAIADAAIATIVDANGVLREPCESGDCGGDGPQFKGIFIRYLAYLYDTTHKQSYYDFLYRNARAVWNNDRNVFNQLGLRWSGPLDSADASRQSSAMMPLAAMARPMTADLGFARPCGDPVFKHSLGAATGTLAWFCSPANTFSTGFMQYGPYTFSVPAGVHAAHFRLAVNGLSASPANLVRLDVRENNAGTTLASRDVPWNAFLAANQDQDFALLFTNTPTSGALEFRVYWNNVPGAPALTAYDVTVDGLMNWTAATLTHDVGRLDGANNWRAEALRDKVSGFLSRGAVAAGLYPGQYSAQFELKVDDFARNQAVIAAVSVADADTGSTVASRNLARNEFPNALFRTFTLNFNAVNGRRYEFRTFWYYTADAPSMTQRSVLLRPGANSFFTQTALSPNAVALGVIGQPGHTYAVQASGSLEAPQWQPAGTVTIPAALGWATFTDSLGPTNRYYRLAY